MKKLILASLAVAALASCSKESTMDVAITSTQIPIEYSTYAGSATTKGTPINKNSEFAVNDAAFEVSAYAMETGVAGAAAGKYFSFSTVTSNGTTWDNTDDTYWPNYDATLYLGAYYPSVSTRVSEGAYAYDSAHSLTLNYVVNGDVNKTGSTLATSTVDKQEDLMYAVTSQAYTAPTKDESDKDSTADSEEVNLHFKHALTQVGFTATKDANIDVTVKSIQICNVMSSGKFSATKVTDDDDSTDGDATDNTVSDGFVNMANTCEWNTWGDIAHYKAYMNGNADVTVGTSKTTLTADDQVLMLIPQALTAWTYSDTEGNTGVDGSLASKASTDSYLAIECTIKHTGNDVTKNIIDGTVFVPFSTANIVYENGETAENTWKPGYKITYNLHFGGGYTDPTPDPDKPTVPPTPGETPDPDDLVETLRPITYTTSVDAWETAYSAPEIDLE